MPPDDNEEKLLRSVALQNARAVLLARERAERELVSAKEALEKESAELRKQREFFRVTLASIGDAVITTDAEAKVTFLNPVAEEMTGWKSEEAIGQPLEKVFNIIHEQTRQASAESSNSSPERGGSGWTGEPHGAYCSRWQGDRD